MKFRLGFNEQMPDSAVNGSFCVNVQPRLAVGVHMANGCALRANAAVIATY